MHSHTYIYTSSAFPARWGICLLHYWQHIYARNTNNSHKTKCSNRFRMTFSRGQHFWLFTRCCWDAGAETDGCGVNKFTKKTCIKPSFTHQSEIQKSHSEWLFLKFFCSWCDLTLDFSLHGFIFRLTITLLKVHLEFRCNFSEYLFFFTHNLHFHWNNERIVHNIYKSKADRGRGGC